MKNVLTILLLTIHHCFCHAQIGSPGLDALVENSQVIVQGVILNKYCRFPMNAHSAMVETCVSTIRVENILKGAPQLSILGIQKHVSTNPSETITQYDTIEGLCFEHSRMRLSFNRDTINPRPEYNVLVGDYVIVFLGGNAPDPNRRIQIPEEWIVYYLIDGFLGIITANDYVIDNIKKKNK